MSNMSAGPVPQTSFGGTPRMSSAARIPGALFSPAKTFDDIVREPHFILCWAVQVIIAEMMGVILLQRVGAHALAMQVISNNARLSRLPAAQQTLQLGIMERFIPVQCFCYGLFPLLGGVVIALVLWAVAVFLMGHNARFKQVLSIVVHGMLPMGVFGVVAICVVALASDPTAVSFINPVGTNPAFYMDPSTVATFWGQFLLHLDAFALWSVFLLAIGLSRLARKPKLGGALAWMTVLFLAGIALSAWANS